MDADGIASAGKRELNRLQRSQRPVRESDVASCEDDAPRARQDDSTQDIVRLMAEFRPEREKFKFALDSLCKRMWPVDESTNQFIPPLTPASR